MDIAVVTGASSGLGTQFVKGIAERYPHLDEIWMIARRKEKMEELASEVSVKTRIISLDLGADESYEKLKEMLARYNPNIQLLINNAGYEKSGEFMRLDERDIQNMIAVNIKGMTMVQRICLSYMPQNSFTIMTCSVTAFAPIPYEAVYSASKKYMYYLAKALRYELKQKGVNILLLCPGNMDTEMNPKGQFRQSEKIGALPYLDMKEVVQKSLIKAEKGQAVYTPGIFYKLFRLSGKMIPSSMMSPVTGYFFRKR